ncbi:MAG: MarR family transcriptional regulator, partial [Cohaesibacteraceae bacterium]|nr:MarR family transcriptional regulator [Cohaesibacteraceae bacterium]MBL4876762.1 MarR family transcriptional regulator [Cohaesibacteraceae bacterium]
METPTPTTTAIWTQLLSRCHEFINQVETAFKQAGHPPLSWYDALLEIEKAGV